MEPSRKRRCYSLMEITLVFVLLAAAAALVAPRLLSGEQAGAARDAQAGVEAALDAALRLSASSGAPSSDLSALEQLAPRLTFLDAVSPSTGTAAVSVASSAEFFAAVAFDGHGTCWGVLHRFAGTGALSTYFAIDTASCTASELTSREGDVLPDGAGTSWSNPWGG